MKSNLVNNLSLVSVWIALENIDVGKQLASEVKEEVLALGNLSQAFAPRVRLKDLYVSRVSCGKSS